MPLFTKPQFNSVWASTGSKLAPDVAKINQGWVVEIPPHEFDNWMQNRQDALLAHLNQLGIPQWDATVEYQAGKSYVQGTNTGTVYRALTTHTNINPETDIQNNWAVAFQSSGTALLKVNNLSDVPDKAQARTNLGIATTEFYDGRYLIKTNNLADVPNKATSRSNLDVYSRVEVEALLANAQPAGQISYFPTLTPPAGWLVMDGSAVSRETYPRLFAVIGTLYGSGNGSTTFNLPNALGEFFRSIDLGRGIDAGRVIGSVQMSQNLAHIHSGITNSSGEHEHSLNTNGVAAGRVGVNEGALHSGSGKISSGTTASGIHSHNLVISSSGGNESRPRNIAFLPCIRT